MPGGGQGSGGVSFVDAGRRLDRRRGRLLDPGRDGHVASRVFTITRRNPVTAVMSLVGHLLRPGRRSTRCCRRTSWPSLQVLVYAGAIMVLFIFVVMILNREEVDAVGLVAACVAQLVGVLAARLPA